MNAVLYILLGLAALSGARLLIGPTLQDRLMAANLISVQIVLMMCCVAVLHGRGFYLDVAMVCALLSFAEVIAFVRFGLAEPERGEPACSVDF